jgi:hypothetical protein
LPTSPAAVAASSGVRRQVVDDDEIDRDSTPSACRCGLPTDDFSDQLFSKGSRVARLLDEAHARIFAAEQGYDPPTTRHADGLVGLLLDDLAEKRGLLTPETAPRGLKSGKYLSAERIGVIVGEFSVSSRMSAFALTGEARTLRRSRRTAGANGGGPMVRDRARYHGGNSSFALRPGSPVSAVFGIEMAGSATACLN